jgi:phosphoglycerol transferase
MLMAGSGAYFAFFSCFLLLTAGLWAAFQHRTLRPLVLSGIFLAVIGLVGFAQILPTILHHFRNGANPDAVVRVPDHVEIFALKIDNLLFPMPGHWLEKVIHPSYTEGYNFGTNLGILGGLGFLIVLAKFLFGRVPRTKFQEPNSKSALANFGDGSSPWLLDSLGILLIACLLLATTGGFGYLFSWLATPWIRCYYRISIFIAFLSLFGLVIVLDKIAKNLSSLRHGMVLSGAVSFLILVAGLWDQTSKNFIPAYEVTKAEFQNDANFVHAIESRMPGQAVFQLPHVPWPEYTVGRINSYDPFRGYLHSKTLRWSGGAIKGRPADYWGQEVSHQPPQAMVRVLALAGFSGIYLDRDGYRDRGTAIEAELVRVLGAPALVSANQKLVYFDLNAYDQNLRHRFSDKEWEEERRKILTAWSTSVSFKGGFSRLEHMPYENWRWCSAKGTIEIGNFTDQPRPVCLEMGLSGSDANLSSLLIDGPSFTEHLQITGAKASPFRRCFTIPPGRHEIHFLCDGKPLDAPTDPRQLVFRVHNFRVFWLNPPNDDYQPGAPP